MSAYIAFKKRFERYLSKGVKLLGDIPLDVKERQQLYETVAESLKDSPSLNKKHDLVIAVALVRVGMHEYKDGNYWSNFNKAIGIELNSHRSSKLGRMFLRTLKHYNLPIYQQKNTQKYVQNILTHGFVPDCYLEDFLGFTYAFYEMNLSCDLSRDVEEEIDNLRVYLASKQGDEDVTLTAGKVPKSHYLRKSTCIALSMSDDRGRNIFLHVLKQIDRHHWDQILPKAKNNRFNKWLINWVEETPLLVAATAEGLPSRKKGRYQFLTPYKKLSPTNNQFCLVIPSQKIRNDQLPTDPFVQVTIEDKVTNIALDTYEIFAGGYRSEQVFVPLKTEDLFQEISIDLLLKEKRNIGVLQAKDYIFFDNEFVEINNVVNGNMFILAKPDTYIRSDEILDKYKKENFIMYQLYLEDDDIVYIDSVGFSPQGKMPEGITNRGKCTGVTFGDELENSSLVYAKHPDLNFQTKNQELTGIGLVVNGQRFRLIDYLKKGVYVKELPDGEDSLNVLVQLEKILDKKIGVYELSIERPNETDLQCQKYLLIPHFNYHFEGAPYIFQDTGIISLTNGEMLKPLKAQTLSPNSYQLIFDQEINYALFKIETKDLIGTLKITIPILKWSVDNCNWQIHRKKYLWHNDIKDKLYIQLPFASSLSLVISQTTEYLEGVRENDGWDSWIYSFDIQQFSGYFNQSKKETLETRGRTPLELVVQGERIPFTEVVAQNFIISNSSSPSLENNLAEKKCYLRVDMVGRNKAYVDIVKKNSNKIIVDSSEIIDGEVVIDSILTNGCYDLSIYEVEEDFGLDTKSVLYYAPIEPCDVGNLGIRDLSKCNLIIKSIKENMFYTNIDNTYKLSNVKPQTDNTVFTGDLKLVDENLKKSETVCLAKVIFLSESNYSRAILKCYRDNEWDYLLFDTETNKLLKEEDPKVSRKEAYRRYKVLDDKYVFNLKIEEVE